MEAPRGIALRVQRRQRIRRVTVVALVTVLLLVIVVPCAILLPHSGRPFHASTVLLPLYIYPVAGAWDPLFHAINASTSLNYTVVLNPSDGPEAPESHFDDYVPAVQRLNSASNVQTIGYVRTAYATRDMTSVLHDVMLYSDWQHAAPGLALNGIFFDEAPHEYSADAAKYMANISQAVKDANGFLEPRLVIHNPGTVPDTGLMDTGADVTVVLEQSYEGYQRWRGELKSLPKGRSRYSILLHSVPQSTNLERLLGDMNASAEYLFATNLEHDYYKRFGQDWPRLVHAMP